MSVPADTDEQADGISQPPPRYGETLLNGRKRFNYTVERISEELNISRDIIEMIDDSATVDLPPATFMQGYIKAYAKLVEVDPEQALRDYATVRPDGSTTLKARSNLPRETDSHSPLISIITRLLLIAAVMAVFYGVFTYYSDKMRTYETASNTDKIAISEAPGLPLEITEPASSIQDDDLSTSGDSSADTLSDPSPMVEATAESEPAPIVVEEPVVETPTQDTFVLYAEQDSWVEVTGSDNERLHYNLLKAGQEISLTGYAPFSVFLGNAPQMTMSLNGLEVSVENFIRGNNTAQFRVSVEDGDVVFQRR